MERKKVLLAEDDADDRILFLDFLEHRQDILIMPVAENGETLLDAIKMIQDQKDFPHLIVLDQNMPKLNGLQTLQILKADTRYAAIPVIVYSTYIDELLTHKAYQDGALKVVTKPNSKDGYHKMMDQLLELISENNGDKGQFKHV